MTTSSSKKLETASRLIEQRIPAQMAYRMMGLKDRAQMPDVIIQFDAICNNDHILPEYRRYRPKNTLISQGK
ncbi:hypothetical protein L3V86_06610 [Thiotrichales bacterium 19S11-10]|nr:hypothetical protein [Thiotrichales bacterium 19S11-10]MCF6807574.1 hypothetical protein [Thiotrichales bacterium 19S9-11]MCF6811543.1 hypothetical protein [Thiotrichales bacterium 19S9-12]